MRLRDTLSSVLHLLEELVSRVLVAVLLHLGQVALLGSDGGVHLVVWRRREGVCWLQILRHLNTLDKCDLEVIIFAGIIDIDKANRPPQA